MSVLTDDVAEVKAAIDASPDPDKLRKRIAGELRTRYPDLIPAGATTDKAVIVAVVHEHPEIIERCRHLLVRQDALAPLEAIVLTAMTETMACLEYTATHAMGARYTVSWPAGSTTVKGRDGRRYKVELGADQIAADLTEA